MKARHLVLVLAAGSARVAHADEDAAPEPARLPPPPTQNNAAGGGAAKVEEAPIGLSMFGKIGWEAIIDPQNQGDYLQEESPPPALHPPDWHVGFPNVDYIGAVFVGPKRGAWQARGTAVLGLLYYRKFRLDVAWGEIRNDDVGFSLTVGRIYNPIVNSLDPGTYGDQTELGSILYVLNGIKLSQTVGRFTFDLGVGRPESVTLGETPPLEGSAGSIYGESRLSYMNPNVTGVLYGRPTPLVLSVSGAIGLQRVGPGENLAALATPPPPAVTESLPAWMASAEARVPLGPVMLLGEVYVGRGAAFYGGAMFRFQRIDLTTGDHSLLLSCGYWGQLSVRPSHGTELIAVAGVDRNLSGFAGVDAAGSADITSNRWLAGIFNIDLTREFRLGLQGQWITSSYPKYGTFSHPGAIIDFSFHW